MKLKQAAVILLFLMFSGLFTSAQDEATLVKNGDQVPSFTFETSPGKTQNISEFKGKTVLITFFATWCGPCRKELPHIQAEVYNKYKNNPNFELIILGREHSWAEVNKFKADNKFTMPFYPDPERKVFAQFAKQSIPRNFLISPDGKILFSTIGFEEKDFKQLKKVVDNQLKVGK